MADSKLAFAGISGISVSDIFRGGSTTTTFLRIRANTTIGSNDLTNVTFNSGAVGLNEIRIGQVIFASGVGWSDNTTIITAIDLGNNTLTVADTPTANNTAKLMPIRPSKGQTYIQSGSITAPQNSGISFRDITGSIESDYDPDTYKWNVSFQLADILNDSQAIAGEFGQYEVTEIIYRSSDGNEASFYVSASTEGILQEPDNRIPVSSFVGFPIYEVSKYGNLGPSFSPEDLPNAGVSQGSARSTYQNVIQDYYDDLEVYVAHSGSTVEENIQFINFTGSGIQSIITSSDANGKRGVEIKIEGGGSGSADDDWFIGDTFLTASKDVRITGSLLVNRQDSTSDFFLIKSGSYDTLKVDSEGITRFFAHIDETTPWATPDYGGLYFMSSSVWVAID
jgi:hypothetical protein